ncbi:MAG: hypothetical protein Q4D26_01365 [Clostridia bacterium]|nr:hypothetical protein [Clostridia bacterium]
MKKKLLSIIALAMAMTMTTSAFAAPRARGTGDVDGDSLLTANDVLKILNEVNGGESAGSEANTDGRSGITGSDVNVAYKTLLQPKNVKEDLVFNVYSNGLANDVDYNVMNASDFGVGTKADEKGTEKVDEGVSVTPATTIKDAIDQLVDLAANQKTAGINDQLNKIYFNSANKGEVYLRSENGWSMLCNALRYIVPMDAATAALCNKASNANYDPETATEEQKARYDALMEAKKLIVGSDKAPAADITEEAAKAQCTTELTAADIIKVKDALCKAIPSGLEKEAIENTAKEVLKITDTKYAVTAEFNGSTETLSEAGVDTSAFISALVSLADYEKKNMADFRAAFGDKLAVSNGNIDVTFEVAVVASAQ